MPSLRHSIPAVLLLSAALHSHAEGADVQRGRAVIEKYGCAACHVIPGITGAQGLVGPPLTQLGKRVYIAGILPNTQVKLAAWLFDPPAINPKTAMPKLGLTEQEAHEAAAYLLTLR